MTPPRISLIASATRPENWMGLYRSVGSNDVSFECVFAGPNEPGFPLPDNFVFIKTNVKPAQCWEIASRKARGDLLMPLADDLVFVTEHPLDKLHGTYEARNDDRVMVSCRFRPGGDPRTRIDHRFFHGDTNSPLLPLGALMCSRLWREIGGIDRRFIAACWDVDIYMRVFGLGGRVVFSDVYVDEDTARSRGSALMRDHRGSDRVLLEQLWSAGGRVHFNRTLPVEPFPDKDILLRSQDPQGRWRYESDLMNRIITGRTYYRLKTCCEATRGRIKRFRLRNIPKYIRRLLTRR